MMCFSRSGQQHNQRQKMRMWALSNSEASITTKYPFLAGCLLKCENPVRMNIESCLDRGDWLPMGCQRRAPSG
jgi:hypothetical protein